MKARQNPRADRRVNVGLGGSGSAASRSHRHNLFGAEALSIRLDSLAVVGNDHMRAAACQDRRLPRLQRAKLSVTIKLVRQRSPAEGHLRQAHSDHALCLDREHRGKSKRTSAIDRT